MVKKHHVSFVKLSAEDIKAMLAKSDLELGKLFVPEKNKFIGLASVDYTKKGQLGKPKHSSMYKKLHNRMKKLGMDTSSLEAGVAKALEMNFSDLKKARKLAGHGRNTKKEPFANKATRKEKAAGEDLNLETDPSFAAKPAASTKDADNLQKVAMKIEEKEQNQKAVNVQKAKPEANTEKAIASVVSDETGIDRAPAAQTMSASTMAAEKKGSKIYGGEGLIGQTGAKEIKEPPPPQDIENVQSQIQTTPETVLTEQVIDEPVAAALPAVSQPTAPNLVNTNDVEKETKERKKKTTERLKKEITCFRLIFQDLIKTANWRRLQKKPLDVDITQLRYCHAEYTEAVREYYNKERGLRIGVIIDPKIMGLNVQALQNMLAPSMANSLVSNVITNAKPELLPNEKIIPPTQPPKPQAAVRPIDIHHRLGGVRHALQQPPPQELRELTHSYDGQERKKMEDINLHGKGNIKPNNYINYHRRYYARPGKTSHIPIKIKTANK